MTPVNLIKHAMKLNLLILLPYYLSLFRVHCSSGNGNTGDFDEISDLEIVDFESVPAPAVVTDQVVPVTRNHEPLYRHQIGITNIKYTCYMNALISCLYNIPFFQKVIYEIAQEIPQVPPKNQSTFAALADVLVKLRLEKSAISLSNTIFPAISSKFQWTLGEYQDVMEFWDLYVEAMEKELRIAYNIQQPLQGSGAGEAPLEVLDKFREIFAVDFESLTLSKSNGTVLKKAREYFNYVTVPLPTEPISISSLIATNFLDENPDPFNIYVNDQKRYESFLGGPITQNLQVPCKMTITIKNTPNVMIFGVKRLDWDREAQKQLLNSIPIDFDEFVLNDELYIPVSWILFNGNHYYAIVKDLGNDRLYIHNDNYVSQLAVHPKSYIKEVSSMIVTTFYVKKSALEALKVSEFEKIRAGEDIPNNLKEIKETRATASSSKADSNDELVKKRKRSNASTSDYSKKRRSKRGKTVTVADSTAAATAADVGADADVEDDESEKIRQELHKTINEIFGEDDPIDYFSSDQNRDMATESSGSSTVEQPEILTEQELGSELDPSWFEHIFDESYNSDESTLVQQRLDYSRELEAERLERLRKESLELAAKEEADKRKKSAKRAERVAKIMEKRKGQSMFKLGLLTAKDKQTEEKKNKQKETLMTSSSSALGSSSSSTSPANSVAVPFNQSPTDHSVLTNFTNSVSHYSPANSVNHYSPANSVTHYSPANSMSHYTPATSFQTSFQPQQMQQQQLQPQFNSYQQQTPTLSRQQRIERAFAIGTEKLAILREMYAKLTNPDFMLGYSPFTFTKDDKSSYALQLVLVALISNSLFVEKLFEITGKSGGQVEIVLSSVLIQILVGNTKISMTTLIDLIGRQILDSANGSLMPKIQICLEFFGRKLHPDLIPFVSLKSITYSELITDEAIEITTAKSVLYRMTPERSIVPRDANIPGIFHDRESNGNRLRHVINSTGSLIPLIIDRKLRPDGGFDSTPLVFKSEDFMLLGSINYSDSQSGEILNAQFRNNFFSNSFINISRETGGQVFQFSDQNAFQEHLSVFHQNIARRSHVVFFIKKDFWRVEPMRVSHIPEALKVSLLTKIGELFKSTEAPMLKNIHNQNRVNQQMHLQQQPQPHYQQQPLQQLPHYQQQQQPLQQHIYQPNFTFQPAPHGQHFNNLNSFQPQNGSRLTANLLRPPQKNYPHQNDQNESRK